MRKLRLNPDALRVESFDVHDGALPDGTVLGHSYPNQCEPTSDTLNPADYTCQFATCGGPSCWQTCNGNTCYCGTAGCQPNSAGFTYCHRDPSCIDECEPTP